MTLYFAKSTNGFYDTNINLFIPNDAVQITQDQYNALMAAQASGQVIKSNDVGQPITVAPTAIQLTAAQMAANTINAGLQITSQNTPTLNGTYACDAGSQANIAACVTYVILNSDFPGGNTTMPWVDLNGNLHVFPDIGTFKSFATAVANYSAQVMVYGMTNGQAGALPSNQVTIL